MSNLNQGHIAHRFNEVACNNPENIALLSDGIEITYRQLDAASNYIAQQLKTNGVGQGSHVAICMPRSPILFATLVAMVKLGAVYVPVDAQQPISRIRQQLASVKASLFVTDSRDKVCLAENTPCLCLSEECLIRSADNPASGLEFNAEDPIYILQTSGSTGTPKSVVVPHRAVYRLVVNSDYIDIQSHNRFLQFAPLNFDASTLEIWGPLLNGGALVIYPNQPFNLVKFGGFLQQNKVDTLWLTAALFHMVATQAPESLSSVKTLLAGGDVLHASHISELLKARTDLTIINGYGPTENTTFTCCHVMTSDNSPKDIVPIGKAIAGTQVHVLGEDKQPVTQGEIGELYASGSGVALGYLNIPPVESNFFYDNRIAEGLIYRTGDLVRRNDNNEIEFIGRHDNQVKIRGFRVSLEEIQTSLRSVSSVKDAIAHVKKFETGDQILVANVVLNDGHQSTPQDLKAELKALLPDYMIPNKIILNDQLPINLNGKLDRKQVINKPL